MKTCHHNGPQWGVGSHLLCQISLRVNLPVPRAGAVELSLCGEHQVPRYRADALRTLKWCIPVPSWSRWWQRRNSRWANWNDMQRDGTNHGVKHESTLVQAARAVGVTSGSQVLWEPDSLAELWKTKAAQGPLLPSITRAQCLSTAMTENPTVNTLITKYYVVLTHKSFVFFLVHFMLNILFGLFAESVQTVLQSPACLLTSHPMSPLLVSQNWCTVCCHTGARRPQLWAWLCSLKPETPRARANVPLLLYFSLLSTLTFRELIYTLYRGPTGHCTEWHRQTFQSGPLANGTTGILSSLGHPLKVTF